MKNNIYTLLILFTLSPMFSQAQSKAETVTWLKTYMQPELDSWNTNSNQEYHSLNSEEFVYCYIAYYSQYCRDQYTIEFKNIKSISIPESGKIKLSGSFNYKHRDSYNDGKLTKDEDVGFVEISFLNNMNTEEEDLRKIMNALKHLAELNGAKLTDAGLFDN